MGHSLALATMTVPVLVLNRLVWFLPGGTCLGLYDSYFRENT